MGNGGHHVAREIGREIELLAGGVDEGEASGVQHLTTGDHAVAAGLAVEAVVDGVTHHWIAGICGVYANLVRAAGFNRDFGDAGDSEAIDDDDAGLGWFARRNHGHPLALGRDHDRLAHRYQRRPRSGHREEWSGIA